MSEPSVKPDGLLTIRKTPHNDVVKLLTELVTELRIENEDLKQMLMNQRSLMCGQSRPKPDEDLKELRMITMKEFASRDISGVIKKWYEECQPDERTVELVSSMSTEIARLNAVLGEVIRQHSKRPS